MTGDTQHMTCEKEEEYFSFLLSFLFLGIYPTIRTHQDFLKGLKNNLVLCFLGFKVDFSWLLLTCLSRQNTILYLIYYPCVFSQQNTILYT